MTKKLNTITFLYSMQGLFGAMTGASFAEHKYCWAYVYIVVTCVLIVIAGRKLERFIESINQKQ